MLQNLSTSFLQTAKSYTTNDVNLCWLDIKDQTANFLDSGYSAIGTKSSSVPTSSTASHKGGLAGRIVSKLNGSGAAEIGGTGKFEDPSAVGVFGFTAKNNQN